MNTRPIFHGMTKTRRQSESGVALLTVLALLSIFAVVLVGFTYSIRMEENTMKQYADSVNVQEATEAAIQGVLAQLTRDLDPMKPNFVLGRPQPRYTSLLEPWAVGYAGMIGKNLSYDARSHELDVRPQMVYDRSNLRFIPTPIPRGVDEDPTGDVTGMRGIMKNSPGDAAAGLKNVDDDLDGKIDTNPAFDDDEDDRTDEDGYDVRRDGKFFPPGTGYDLDGDRLGVFDENAKININFAGNTFGDSNGQTYNLGVSPSELDLPVFLYNRIVQYANSAGANQAFSAANAEMLAKQIVSFRYGSVADGGTTVTARPGEDGKDDNNNGNPKIVTIQAYSNALNLPQFDNEPFAIVGNSEDDDGDGLMNEEDEHYIGPSTENSSGTPLTDAFSQTNAEYYRPGDKIDNNGNGYIDEQREGVDDPAEFSVFKPKGDDHPYTTVEDLKLVGAMRGNDPSPKLYPTIYDILSDYATIYSQADEISGPLSGRDNEVGKINPNLTSNWLAEDIWNINRPAANKADFQYSPKVRVEDLLALQVDNDGDWQPEAEVNIENEIDDDGDGLVDEPADDWDENHYPSGDFDGAGEADVGAPAFASGNDFDHDGQQIDKINTGGNKVFKNQRILGWSDGSSGGDKVDASNFDPLRSALVTYGSKLNDIYPGLVVEGNGQDDDGDTLIDDTGDLNGDGLVSYDPEWHVSEDAWGDASGDGYPGLGADPEADNDSREGEIIQDPDNTSDLLITSLADDDYDGYADFYDPQVLAAMFAPEWDNVDNDNDGEVDEIGERYIACYDDDEDGRMDEDPPEFQLALNLADFIDTWMPFPPAEDADVRQLLGVSNNDPILADPVTCKTLTVYSTRQRAFRMHSRLLAGPNSTANDRQEFAEQMRLMLPNPPQIGYPIKFEGVEAIRINEVMPKPVIRLEAEEVLDGIQSDQTDPKNPVYTISYKASRFEVKGNNDDGVIPTTKIYDTNWGSVSKSADGQQAAPPIASYTVLPTGFKNTFNPFLPILNMDSMAPAFIFSVTNVAEPVDNKTTKVGTTPEEEATWLFENIPAGYYDVVLYLHPYHKYRPEVRYSFNGQEIPFRSDFAVDDVLDNTGDFLKPWESEVIRRDIAVLPGSSKKTFPLHYRLTPYPLTDKYNLTTARRVTVGTDGKLEVTILAGALKGAAKGSNAYYETSFDRIELISPWVQYVELVNLSTEDINLSGWTVNTPYGHYVIPKDTVIGRMKPSYDGDDGLDLQPNQGLPGNGVPFEPLLDTKKTTDVGTTISSTDLRLEDNKLLLANHKDALIAFIKDNYPSVPRIDERVVEPVLSSSENAMIQRSLSTERNPLGSGELRNAQAGDLRFRLVDVQEDILSHNPVDKYVTLCDPAGQYVDSFKYRTTFNNLIVDIPGNDDSFDLVALPGYRGMESFERSDPTYFETKMVVDKTSGDVSGDRSVPSSIKLDAKDAIILNLDATKDFARTQIGGVISLGQGKESDKKNPNLKLQRFADVNSFPPKDSHWNGWDFLGDYFEYPKDNSSIANLAQYERRKIFAPEAVAPTGLDKVRFYDLLGGFENALDVRTTQQVRYSAFVWRMGLRELIRAGYDPDVDDQLTVRILGRMALFDDGQNEITYSYGTNTYTIDRTNIVDLPVGEVLVIPTFRVIDPGKESIDQQSKQTEVNPFSIFSDAVRSNRVKTPVFAKLRNGDTAFTIDLRKQFTSLIQDLKTDNEAEPVIEIMVVLRKSTPDQGLGTTSTITAQTRPDLATLLQKTKLNPDATGNYHIGLINVGNLGDDNYYLRGIELFGRGRQKNDDSDNANAHRSLLAGTPGRDNTGYVPAYPRRRLKQDGKQRDRLDVADNTAYVKNGPLATVGELSRLFTGNRFETVNTPLIAQRVEDIAAAVSGRINSNPDLGKRAMSNSPEYSKALSQRERLDQWENQYQQLYNMITTAETGIRMGLINVNTASREVLMALPFCPPTGAGQLDRLQNRSDFNSICADFILSGRFPNGFDMGFGVHNLDDDNYLTYAGKTRSLLDSLPEFKLWSVGREYKVFKNLEDIESERFGRMNLTIENVKGDKGGNLRSEVYLSTELSKPDDGPYEDIGTLLTQMTHLRRRDRFAEMMMRTYDRTLDRKVDAAGDLREQLNASTVGRAVSTEEMESIMNRISNLITVRSRAFSIVTRGRIFDSDGNVSAQRKLEAVYQR